MNGRSWKHKIKKIYTHTLYICFEFLGRKGCFILQWSEKYYFLAVSAGIFILYVKKENYELWNVANSFEPYKIYAICTCYAVLRYEFSVQTELSRIPIAALYALRIHILCIRMWIQFAYITARWIQRELIIRIPVSNLVNANPYFFSRGRNWISRQR